MSGLPLLSGASAAVKRPASIRWKRWRARRASAGLLRPAPAAVQPAHGLDHLDVAQHRLAEGELVDAGGDLARARRQAVAVERGELDDQRVADRAFAAEREKVGVGREAAVPVGAAVDGDGVVQGGQARRGQHRLHRDLAAAEQARAARGHVGGGDQQLGARAKCAGWRNRRGPRAACGSGSKPSGLKS